MSKYSKILIASSRFSLSASCSGVRKLLFSCHSQEVCSQETKDAVSHWRWQRQTHKLYLQHVPKGTSNFARPKLQQSCYRLDELWSQKYLLLAKKRKQKKFRAKKALDQKWWTSGAHRVECNQCKEGEQEGLHSGQGIGEWQKCG